MLATLLHQATTRLRGTLRRLGRKIVLAVLLGAAALAAMIYLFAALYQLLLPLAGPAGADFAIATLLALLCLGLLLALRR